MFFWHNTHQFCGSCGFKTISKEGGFVKICSNDKCGKSHFPRTDPAIITLISSQDKILLGNVKDCIEELKKSLLSGILT